MRRTCSSMRTPGWAQGGGRGDGERRERAGMRKGGIYRELSVKKVYICNKKSERFFKISSKYVPSIFIKWKAIIKSKFRLYIIFFIVIFWDLKLQII